MAAKIFSLSGVGFVKRITIGNPTPSVPYSEEEVKQATSLLNKCLSEPPKGHIIGIEKNFILLNMGEHQVIQQWIVYHVGFERKPLWID
ncbi:hypothetical protein ACLH9T_004833 [Salmonella enterica]|uniref:hypothetical protein n=1 Tax=Salmonella enterica TaxID=28901 RepID=UPI0009B0A5C1|nr:hypothetical protein [Salmonella enterica]EBV4143491.1 hypothetical protein [Salmonella enterica subsp. enterica serovar Benin]ECG5862810.1 hypothetical protein [Salmonella enterica subsp. enterica serovar Oranienburg]ECI0837417.1 hypothetical protein [Salmonella enterica subsp. diarizonae]WGI51861.1 hypothetical protein QBX66_10995 [Salmonella enterica subsp. diarizonae serovar 48:i:z]EBC1278831.1 hypothetical protein [Salmonella enterica]